MSKVSPLVLAIQNEQAEIAFYLKEAKKTKNRAARTLFELLADQEKHHITLLEDLSKRATEQGAWPRQIDTATLKLDVSKELERIDGLVTQTPTKDSEDVQALKKALDFEHNAQQFYTQLANQRENAQEKSFFLAIAGFERDHASWISSFLAALVEDGDE